MHELSIASALFEMVRDQASRFPAERVVAVGMSVGGLQALEPDAMRACFALLCEGTELAGAKLVIERRPVSIFCRDCDAERVADARFACATCGNYAIRLLDSQGMRIEKITLRSREEAMDDSHEC